MNTTFLFKGGFFIFETMNVQDFYSIFKKAQGVVIDSRRVTRGDLFLAFSGETYNAAQQAENAIHNGAVAAIVEDRTYENAAINIFYVSSTLKFLQELASYHRDQLQIPIIGLTGSNGKTTTKELISTVLSKHYCVQYTEGNLNNHIGVPLTLLSIKPHHEIAVVEMGANHQREIAELCKIAKPTLGYITNFGKAHLEGFGGLDGVIKGKSELYDFLIANQKTILVNENDEIQTQKTIDYTERITFGKSSSDYYFEMVYVDNFVGIRYRGSEVISKLTGSYNFTNICCAVVLGLHLGVEFQDIKRAIENYQPTNMRSQILQKGDVTLVLDTYNANPSSMSESLKNFSGFEGSKTVILGDMLELGDASAEEHSAILALAGSLGFDAIITVGPNFSAANSEYTSFSDAAELADYLKEHRIGSKSILLKGSRGIALEKVLDYLG